MQVQLTFENEVGVRRGYLEERSSKLASLECTLFTPVRNARRPESRFRLSGKTVPKAKISIKNQEILANDKGFFEGIIQLEKQGTHTVQMQIEAAGFCFACVRRG